MSRNNRTDLRAIHTDLGVTKKETKKRLSKRGKALYEKLYKRQGSSMLWMNRSEDQERFTE